MHWRQISVVAEAIILTIVSFLPQSHNLLANSLTSLACGIQVESFRKIHGNGIATTMCIGNLRSGTQNIYTFFQTKKREALEKGLLYYGIILCFICGAIIGNQCIICDFSHKYRGWDFELSSSNLPFLKQLLSTFQFCNIHRKSESWQASQAVLHTIP